MADSAAFEWTVKALEGKSALSNLALRGTLRLALKDSGLDPTQVTPQQMRVVFKHVLVPALQKRGVSDAPGLCETLTRNIEAAGLQTHVTTHDIFKRIGNAGH